MTDDSPRRPPPFVPNGCEAESTLYHYSLITTINTSEHWIRHTWGCQFDALCVYVLDMEFRSFGTLVMG